MIDVGEQFDIVELHEKGVLMERYHYKYGRITIDPNKCFGKPCIRDLRMPVTSLLSYLSSGMTVEEILEEWPELELEDIYQALGYAAWAMTERVLPLEGSLSPNFRANLGGYQTGPANLDK